MGTAPGLRWGTFAQRAETEFLVLSLWASASDHERYQSELFPALRQRSGAADDLAAITGELVDLDPAWAVQPDPADAG